METRARAACVHGTPRPDPARVMRHARQLQHLRSATAPPTIFKVCKVDEERKAESLVTSEPCVKEPEIRL